MTEIHSPSEQSGFPVETYLESWRITPTCRERGVDVAWEDAIARLRKVYNVQLARFGDEPGLVLTVSIARTRDMAYRPGRRS